VGAVEQEPDTAGEGEVMERIFSHIARLAARVGWRPGVGNTDSTGRANMSGTDA